MNFFTNFINKIKEKKADMDDRREFLNMVNEEAKPFRRAAYMKEMMKQSINEGVQKAKVDAQKRLPKEKKNPEDFGISGEKEDPWKFLNNINVVKENDKTLIKSKQKKKWVII